MNQGGAMERMAHFSIRVPQAVKRDCEAQAEREGHGSTSQFVREVLERELAQIRARERARRDRKRAQKARLVGVDEEGS